ncbi:PKD domain-containing protein [Krasilnikovia sp. MM14-A1259]|uniref:PKD domain-containing protein n=1 Tax=Krasilnikovia sp. MM14-A1259 TaxID=3373539 RepID=UPI003820D508
MKKTLARLPIATGAVVAVLASVAGPAAATVVVPPTARSGRLVQVGPIADHGFPTWFRDSNNVRLEACITPDDPLCPAPPGSVPDPARPVSFPDNFPDEFFYQLGGANLTLPGGVKATIGLDLEGAFATGPVIPGDQVTFGRVRIRFDAPAGARYRITHPYGVDDVVADAKKGVNVTEDIGLSPGVFAQALNSRIGPFLTWDPAVAPAAPAGYVGDPAVNHQVVGSPYGTNFVRIERLDSTGAVLGQVGYTDLFSVQGRYATHAGVDVDQATYSRDPDGTGMVEVHASSEADQDIQVIGDPSAGYGTTSLRGTGGHYYGRLPFTGTLTPGAAVDVVNLTDQPVATKRHALTDVVTVYQVDYDADAQTLRVLAGSSDRMAPPTLSVAGLGPITDAPFTGVAVPPGIVTVTSSAGGSASTPLAGSGGGFLPKPPTGAATAVSPARTGQTVRLDATASAGVISGFTWTQTAGPAVTLADPNRPVATFVPAVGGLYTFAVTVTGPGGVAAPVSVSVGVSGATANAGADLTVIRGRPVTLNGTASTSAATWSWRQVSGPAARLTGTATGRPAVTYPALTLPAAPGGRPFTYRNDPVVMELTVRDAYGAGTDRVVLRPRAETLSGLTVRYRKGTKQWQLSGRSSLHAGQRVVVVLGSRLTGRVIGRAVTVRSDGTFSLRATGPSCGSLRTVSLVTTTGGVRLGVRVTVTR